MKKILPLMMAAPTLALTMAADAAPQVTPYGQLNLSVDYMDSGISKADEAPDNKLSAGSFGISSNSSLFGLKGELDGGLDNLKLIYQIEQGITADGDDNDSLSTRNTYLGLRYLHNERTSAELLGGYHDTLAKLVTAKTLFKVNVADYSAILGAGANSGSKFEKRVANMALGRYSTTTSLGKLVLAAQVSADTDDKNSKDKIDDTRNSFHALGFNWSKGAFELAAGYDHWNNVGQNNGRDEDADLLRAALIWKSGAWTAIGLAENLRYFGDLDRKAWGGQLGYTQGVWSWAGQWLHANDFRHSHATGANMISVRAQRKITEPLAVFAVATTTRNDENARFQGVDGGHGDELGALAGTNPYALSVGAVLKF